MLMTFKSPQQMVDMTKTAINTISKIQNKDINSHNCDEVTKCE